MGVIFSRDSITFRSKRLNRSSVLNIALHSETIVRQELSRVPISHSLIFNVYLLNPVSLKAEWIEAQNRETEMVGAIYRNARVACEDFIKSFINYGTTSDGSWPNT